MNRILRKLKVTAFIALFLTSNLLMAQSSQVQLGKNFTLSLGDNKQSSTDDPNIKGLLNYYEKQIYFTQNNGQWRPDVLFKADFPHGQALATKQGMLVGTYNQNDQQANYERGIQEEEAMRSGKSFNAPKVKIHGHGWMMKFMNSSPDMNVTSKIQHSDSYNYFMGGNAQTKVANYQEIWYNNVYDNVDVRYYPSEEGTLEYDIVCKPGFNKGLLSIQLDGIENISINSKGELVLQTSVGEMTYPAPVAYQQIDGKRVSVDAEYLITGKNSYTFKLGNYDASQTLLIDPIALRWATWVTTNSAADDHGHGIWVDPADGAIYVMARFSGTGLITLNAFDNSSNGGLDIVLGKYLEPAAIGGAGTRVWQTYIGGGSDENPYALDQGPDGNLYLTGYTSSTDFPLSGGAAFGGGAGIDNRTETLNNIFVMKVNTAGNSIKAAVIGGNGSDNPFDLRLTSAGDVLVCGNTTSTNLLTKYPGSGAVNSASGVDVLLFKLNQNLSSMLWVKNYGGTSDDVATIMLNNKITGEIYVAGYTASTNFPTTVPRQGSKVGATDGFLQKLNSAGTTKWSSYFNGASSKTTQILCMEFDTARSHLYFGGITDGLNASNTSANGVAYDNSYNNGTHDFFVVKMDTAQIWNGTTYIGGANDEINMMGLNVDLSNDAYVFGYSNSTDFPTTGNPLQSTNLGGYDKVFFKLKNDLSALNFSTYYGGSGDDYDPVGERGIKFSNCRIYTIVTSKSNNIPLTNGALLTTKTGSVYEPGLVVWANPPDLTNNTITGSQTVCKGSTPSNFTGSSPSYALPTIIRNGTTSTYPSFPAASTYQWQRSTDSTNWVSISGATNQGLSNSLIGSLNQKTYFRRIIGGDACVIAGAADQSIKVKVLSVPGIIHNVTCFGFNNGSVTANPDGTPVYHYLWNNGSTIQTISGLSPGTYSVTVTDGSNCSASNSFSLTQPIAALSATTSSTNATCGGSNGTASVTPSGGTTPYTYLWSSGAVTSTATGLDAISYNVTVTDANLCSIVKNVTVNQATTLDATIVAADVSCFNGSNGSINLTPSGGTPTYHFAWSNGATTEDINGLVANTYSVTITDANQCSKVKSATVNQPIDISLSETHNDVSCNGGNNGSVDLTVSGGTAPYGYLWSNGNTNQDISGLTFGTYSVTVTDAHSCPKVLSNISVGQPSDISLSKTQVNNICFGGNTGSIDLSVSGGSPGYTYLWSNGATTQDISSLVATVYTVTVTDAHGCKKNLTTTITEPSYIETTGTPVVACESYNLPWNQLVTTTGTYDNHYTSIHGCDSLVHIHVTINHGTHNAETQTSCESFSWHGINYTETGVSTYPYNNGDGCPSVDTLHLTITHGINNSETHTACESYNWNGINYTASGTFTHSYLTDCPSVDTLHLTIHNGTHNAETHVACESYNWHGIDYTVSGTFTHPYENQSGCPSVDTLHLTINNGTHNAETHAACETYNWHGTDYTVTGVFTYPYNNGDGCPSVDTLHLTINHDVITVLDPAVACNQYQLPWTLVLETGNYEHHYFTVHGCDSLVKIHVYISHIEANAVQNGWILCHDGNEGSIDLTASHGIGFYEYNWSNGATTEDISGLSAGTYTVTVTDDTQCSATTSVTIGEPSAIEVSAQTQNASCNGNENGWIDLSVIGGTSPYTYMWSNGATTQDLNNIGAETFYVTVYDANGCTATAYYIVTGPGSADAGDNQTICAGNSVQLSASGGNIYLWTPAASLDNASVYNPVASPTVTTTYTLTISNSSGELVTNGNFEAGNTGFTSDYAFVNTPYSGGYSSGTGLWPEGKYAVGPDPNYYHPSFFGSGYPSGTGNLMIVNGSVTPGTKVWGEVVSVTPNTDYYFSAQISTLVEQSPAELEFTINGSPIGPNLVAPATINNWIQFYAVWNSGTNTGANIKIINGNTIASGNDFGLDDISFTTVCSVTDTVVIHVSHIHTEISSTNVHCPSGNDGSSNLTVTGGIIPYTYSWSNGATTEDLSNLAAGTYTVTVYDAAHCSGLNYVVITQPAAIVITHTVTNASCNNANGGIDVTVTGGTAPYSYDWVNGATTQDLSSIASGDYTLIVTDANGCTATKSIYVSGTPAIILSETHSNATCGIANANVFLTVTGGTAPFDFLWSNGTTDQNLAGVASGTYLVTVTDINGCPAVLPVAVDCTPPLCNMQLTYEHSNNQCFGECDGTIDLTVIGGTMPFAYNWSNGASGIHLMNLCAGDYSVTVTDVNGCFAIANINITQHDPIVIVMDTSNSNCEHLCHCTGAINAFPTGGEGPYSYSWSNNSPYGSTAAGLCPGQYYVTVTDASGCTAVAGAYVDCITLPPPPCQAPTNFTVTNVTSSTATLHWDAVPGAYGYKIRRRAVGTTTWVNTGVLAPAHQKTIQNLQCNTAYEWQIETMCNADQTDVSVWVSTTPNFTTAPYCAMPTGLYADNITSTSARVHWSPVPNATSYRIRYRVHGTTAWSNTGASASATQKTILNLVPGATYDWQLRARCAGSNDVSTFSNSTLQHFTLLNGARMEDNDNSITAKSISIFPNPANNNVTIELNNGCNCNDAATVTITNVLGQLIYTTSINLTAGRLKQEINLPESMIDGLYFVTVRSNEYVETKRLTVSK